MKDEQMAELIDSIKALTAEIEYLSKDINYIRTCWFDTFNYITCALELIADRIEEQKQEVRK